MKQLLFLVCATLIFLPAMSQHKAKPYEKDEGPVVMEKRFPNRANEKRKRYWRMYRKDTKGILYGNVCFQEATRKMGFEYEVTPKGQPGYKNGLQRASHNFFVSVGLVFRAGPWWPFTVRKRKKRCREATADFYG
ncbi:hypothetical protein FUAX_23380 [Fulvitalea axinellae]|uniref:Uncharacterized protein n=1 Tax=Fulvitalea axinellae TaxID=1182444 RepID=A0AAU9CCN9_9BACT|nr:hypothetical protein FUAX_23380 [Fulvitalea axinellae]